MVNDLMRCHALAVRPTMEAVQEILLWGGKLQFSPAAPYWHQ